MQSLLSLLLVALFFVGFASFTPEDESCSGPVQFPRLSDVPLMSDSIKLYRKERFPFTMWLITHRAQFSLLQSLSQLSSSERIAKSPSPTFIANRFVVLFDLVWDNFMTAHQVEEDGLVFPWILQHGGKEAEDALQPLEEDHYNVKGAVEELNNLVEVIRPQLTLESPDNDLLLTTLAKLHDKINAFAAVYKAHALKEEETLVPIIVKFEDSVMEPMAEILKKRGRGAPQASFALLLFRDACASEPEVWEQTFPWFVRNILLPIVSFTNSDYAIYTKIMS